MRKSFYLILISFIIFSDCGFLSAKNKFNQQASSLYFIENKGQITDQFLNPRSDIQYALQTGGLNIFIGNGQFHYQFVHREESKNQQSNLVHLFATAKSNEEIQRKLLMDERYASEKQVYNTYRMDVTLIGANPNAIATPAESLPYYENYYTTGCPARGAKAHTFKRIVYKNIYEGIDWVIYTDGSKLEHEFIVKPGVNPSVIKIKYSGQTSLNTTSDGSIVATTPLGTITEHAPSSYCTDGTPISSKFKLHGDVLSYDVADVNGGIVIDPIIQWGTYYGADTSTSPFYAVATDDSAYVYLCGLTYCATANSIATAGSYQATYKGNTDGYMVKFDSTGKRLWSTYYGGREGDWATGISCDTFGNIFLIGATGSYDSVEIITPGSPQIRYGGGLWDCYLARFNTDGERKWATYLGGTGTEIPASVFCDLFGHVYISGVTTSSDNIATASGFNPVSAGGSEVFLVQYDTACVKKWGTFYGGPKAEFGGGGCSDGFNAYLVGNTVSMVGISTAGTQQPTLSGGNDLFLVKFDGTGSRSWGTYYGGTSDETSGALACDDGGDLYVLAATSSSSGISSAGCFQPTFGGGVTDAILVKFNKVNGLMTWSTYYGGPADENIKLSNLTSRSGGIFITGITTSTSGISSAGAIQPTYGGGSEDAFLAQFDFTGAQKWSTYIGGSLFDNGIATAHDGFGLYMCGSTSSPNNIGTPGTYLPTGGGVGSGFFYQGFLQRYIPDPKALGNIVPATTTGKMNIYPNPTSGSFTLNGLANSSNGTLMLSIADMTGKVVLEDVAEINNHNISHNLKMPENMAAGAYLLKIIAPDNVTVLKLIKE